MPRKTLVTKPAIQTEIDRKKPVVKRQKEVVRRITNEVLGGVPTPPVGTAIVSSEIADAFNMHGLPNTIVLDRPKSAPLTASAPYKIDISKGKRDGRVSQEWMRRPHDQRFTSLDEFMTFLRLRKERSNEFVTSAQHLSIEGEGADLFIRHGDNVMAPTDWAFEQLCDLIVCPRTYLQRLPAPLATQCIQHSLSQGKLSDDVKLYTYVSPDDATDVSLRAFTPPTYGRIYDYDVADILMDVANCRGSWKIPGEMNWANMTHNPYVDITKDNTTLFGSPRDMFMFLCQDDQPIEAGKLPNGDPDVYFRGFYGWNTETGNGTGGCSTFMLRGVCMNRNLWGVEGQKTVTVKHTKNSLERLKLKSQNLVLEFTKQSPMAFVDQVHAARERVIAKTDEERREFLLKRCNFSQRDTSSVVQLVEEEEGHPMASLYDAIQGITALARRQPYQDKRITLEATATHLLKQAA